MEEVKGMIKMLQNVPRVALWWGDLEDEFNHCQRDIFSLGNFSRNPTNYEYLKNVSASMNNLPDFVIAGRYDVMLFTSRTPQEVEKMNPDYILDVGGGRDTLLALMWGVVDQISIDALKQVHPLFDFVSGFFRHPTTTVGVSERIPLQTYKGKTVCKPSHLLFPEEQEWVIATQVAEIDGVNPPLRPRIPFIRWVKREMEGGIGLWR